MKALQPTVRRWRRRNPKRRVASEEIHGALPEVMRRLAVYRVPTTSGGLPIGRRALTRLQRELRDATENSDLVAQDDILQRFRKQLHTLLDH